MEVSRLYIDTNVLIHIFEHRDALSAELRELLLVERLGRAPFLVTSELTLTELLVRPYRTGNDHLIDTYDNWTLSNAYLEVGPVTRPVLWQAAILRSVHSALRTPDAIHLSTAIILGCSHFLTADSNIRDRYEIADSARGGARSAVDILRPDESRVRSLVEAANR